ncbi:MAG TPA: 16S rRNA (guanine(966)-N(2))-methyltransferase RsmD [Rhizomicrobium sp.]
MRLTGGRFGGRLLATPDDARVRPTADKVRQAVFNILAHRDFGIGFALQDARAIDLFAGTGALGLEALSRGARYCLFVDNDADSRALLRRNVETLALTGVTKIWRRDATVLGPMAPGAGGPFDLAFLDPPYRQNLIVPALAALRDGRWLSPHALIVAERALAENATAAKGFSLLDCRTYGDTATDFLALEGG